MVSEDHNVYVKSSTKGIEFPYTSMTYYWLVTIWS